MIYDKLQKQSQKIFFMNLCCLFLFAVRSLYYAVPDEMYVTEGNEQNISLSVPVTLERKEESVAAFQNNAETSYQMSCRFLNLIPLKEVSVHVVESEYLMPSGMPIGIYARTDGVLIIGTGKVTAFDGLNYEPADKLVRQGDYIVSVNGKNISEKEELIEAVGESDGQEILLGILRDGEIIERKLSPVSLADGSYKLGIWVRDDMAGVGTLTYLKENNAFGALGHPISDGDTGSMLLLKDGNVYDTTIVGIVKGGNGSPGELTGVINYNEKYCLGTIRSNTKTGIFGGFDKIPDNLKQNTMPAGMKQEIKKEKAYILSSLDGTLRRYEIMIDDVDFNSKEENKGILFHVTDKRLLEKTGGIVQGMSGSPIIQDEKIIGAVTHVFISDATKGYGVFIENMIRQP